MENIFLRFNEHSRTERNIFYLVKSEQRHSRAIKIQFNSENTKFSPQNFGAKENVLQCNPMLDSRVTDRS